MTLIARVDTWQIEVCAFVGREQIVAILKALEAA
jgi:hypothetical protein